MTLRRRSKGRRGSLSGGRRNARPRAGRLSPMIRGDADVPAWALWSDAGACAPWTVGVEEELMLVDPATGGLVSRSEDVLAALPGSIAAHARAETHGSALELA